VWFMAAILMVASAQRSSSVLLIQSIQRRLEEIEVTFKELEDKGVVLERALRGEPGERATTTTMKGDQLNCLVSVVRLGAR